MKDTIRAKVIDRVTGVCPTCEHACITVVRDRDVFDGYGKLKEQDFKLYCKHEAVCSLRPSGGEYNVQNCGRKAVGCEINGETSDGYHTFNELYHHRAVLFSVVVALNSERAWKSKLHNDGTMYDGMFIVGVDTPQGQATYHYDMEPYWDMFWCKELERAPEWDGHTPDEAIERIGSLRDVVCNNKKVL